MRKAIILLSLFSFICLSGCGEEKTSNNANIVENYDNNKNVENVLKDRSGNKIAVLPEAKLPVDESDYQFSQLSMEVCKAKSQEDLCNKAISGNAKAMRQVAEELLRKVKSMDDVKELEPWLITASVNGDFEATVYLVGLYQRLNEREKTLNWLKYATNKFHDMDLFNELGKVYYLGVGTPIDYQKAFDNFTYGAKLGFNRAQMNLANMYFQGEGTDKNYVEAYAWYATVDSCSKLASEALMYLSGSLKSNELSQAQLKANEYITKFGCFSSVEDQKK